jgi:lipopolysaccharide export system protein LptA
MKSTIIRIFLVIIVCPFVLFSQTNEQLEIVSTDSIIQKTTKQGSLRELIGNVHLRQGNTDMFCKIMRWWVDLDRVVINENVRIFDKVKELVADEVLYNLKTKVYIARGNVVLKDTIRQVTADEIQYFKIEDRFLADGNVIMHDLENYINIYSGYAEIDNQKDYVKIVEDPVLIKHDSTNREELRITGLKMELYDGGEKAVVTDSVHITQKEASATCGVAEFYRDKDEIILKENPVTWQNNDRISGEIIHLYLKNDQLVKAIVKENGLVKSRVDTTEIDMRFNKLTGQQMTMFFKDQEIHKVVVENKATSFYYVVEDGEEKGMNKIIGDKIIVKIKDRKIVDIWIESKPQLSEGIFYPPGFEPDEKEKN